MATTDNGRTITRGLGLLRYPMWGIIAALLLAPAVAMQLGAEGVLWTPSDFIFAGIVLGGAGVLAEIVAWYTRTVPARLIGFGVIAAIVLVVWVEGAVGIFH